MIAAKIRADSVDANGNRITTMEVTMPRFILAQFNTHRRFSRNAASSRAIPVQKMIDAVTTRPVFPLEWRYARKGMQAGEVLTKGDEAEALDIWEEALENALRSARHMANLGVAKEIANRLLEPFAWVTVLVTATEWDNFFALRLHHAAQPEMQAVARAMKEAMDGSSPAPLLFGEWHIPFGDKMPDDADLKTRLAIATARCARLSYDAHDGPSSPQRDVELHDRLKADGHMSPFEHCAKALNYADYANFFGWRSYRYHLEKQLYVN